MIKTGTDVQIQKISEVDNPDVKSGKWETYVEGCDNGEISLPVEYTLKGILERDLTKGGFILAKRYERNGTTIGGIFSSSQIIDINEKDGVYIIQTKNSVYRLTIN